MRANSILLAFFLMIMTSTAHAQGTLRGRVVFEGTPSPAEKIEVKSDVPVCGTHQEVQKIILGADQGVANAVVRVLGTAGKMEPKKGHLDQVNCQFVPHIQALPTGSTLTITSSDSVLHNAHAFNEDGSTAFNVAVPIVGMEVNKKARINPYVTKSIIFRYPFTRKVIVTAPSKAFVCFPGGLGTMHHFFEVLTLIETKKMQKVPVLLYDKKYWQPLKDVIDELFVKKFKTIGPADAEIFQIVDDEEEMVRIIKEFRK